MIIRLVGVLLCGAVFVCANSSAAWTQSGRVKPHCDPRKTTHCHILAHEDRGMVNLLAVPKKQTKSARPHWPRGPLPR
jgi:hypothetical protein